MTGDAALTPAELREFLRLKEGEPFVQATLDAGVAAIRNAYRARGFTRVDGRAMPSRWSRRTDLRRATDA